MSKDESRVEEEGEHTPTGVASCSRHFGLIDLAVLDSCVRSFLSQALWRKYGWDMKSGRYNQDNHSTGGPVNQRGRPLVFPVHSSFSLLLEWCSALKPEPVNTLLSEHVELVLLSH